MRHIDFHVLYLGIIVLVIALPFHYLVPRLWPLWVALPGLVPQGIVLTHVHVARRRSRPALAYFVTNELLLLFFVSAAFGFRHVYA